MIDLDTAKTQSQEKITPDQLLAAGREAPAPEVESTEKVKPAAPAKLAPEKYPAKTPEPPGKAGPEAGGDTIAAWDKEQQAQDAKKTGRKPRAEKTAKTTDKSDKSEKVAKSAKPAQRGRPPKTDKGQKQAAGFGSAGGFGKTAPATESAPAAPPPAGTATRSP